MDQTDTPWRAAILVCAVCAAKRPDGIEPDGRTEIRAWFRGRLAAEGVGKRVRVAETTCLGVCPTDQGITTLLLGAGARSESFVVHGDDERETILAGALHNLRNAPA